MSTVNSIAPDFTLKNTKKEDVSLSDFKGKPVVLAFYHGKLESLICHNCLFRRHF